MGFMDYLKKMIGIPTDNKGVHITDTEIIIPNTSQRQLIIPEVQVPQNDVSGNRSLKLEKLEERKKKVKLILSKKTDIKIVAQVVVVLDASYSAKKLYNIKVVQNTVERIYPIAARLDDDGDLDCWIFSNDYKNLPPVNKSNFENYVENEILRKNHSCAWNGTDYSPVMAAIADKYKNSKMPVYVIFITDGDNYDEYETTQVITRAAHLPIFWQFVGIGKPEKEFEFLKTLDTMVGRFIDNANFVELNDLSTVSVDKLYDDYLLNELPLWYKEAQRLQAQLPDAFKGCKF